MTVHIFRVQYFYSISIHYRRSGLGSAISLSEIGNFYAACDCNARYNNRLKLMIKRCKRPGIDRHLQDSL